MADDKENYKQVLVEPEAFVSMLLHARKHPHQVVHGVLLGSSKDNFSLVVAAAVPVCHGTPMQPWIETSLSLIEAQSEGDTKIVGWYTAPLLAEDTRPGPVALRMASILEASGSKPALIVLNNKAAGDCGKGDTNQVVTAVQAYGKDFGNQYQEKISTLVFNSAKVTKALQEAIESKVSCNDFLDHLEGEPTTTWYPNPELTKLVTKIAS
mmetsp:Transcript_13493/g.25883  ORF Transcript_13493/g.25883 Transcript_13493/m.25883 type:complete len:210 (+) Transcript_13493:62-691(+)